MANRTNRSSTQIMAEILSLCRKPQAKTQVMYKTNLAWGMLQEYLAFLRSNGLLEVHNSRTKYATTQKGLRFVEKWTELTSLLNSE